MQSLRLFLIIYLCLPLLTMANSENIYQFKTVTQNQRFYTLAQKLRCLVCQNESLLDSNAPLAKDLRQQVTQMIIKGKTDNEIEDYLVNRYGEFILYQPVLNKANLPLWIAPFLILFIGIMGYLVLHWKNHR